MLQTLGNHTEGECLNPSDRFVPVLAIGHHAGQGGDFGEPAAIVLFLNFYRERHVGNVPSGPAVQQGDGDATPSAAGDRLLRHGGRGYLTGDGAGGARAH